MFTTPSSRTRKAGKRVGKALAVFESAANELDKASAEHLAAVDEHHDKADSIEETVQAEYRKALSEAEAAYSQAITFANAGRREGFALADEHRVHADTADKAAIDAQVQADSIRSLLKV